MKGICTGTFPLHFLLDQLERMKGICIGTFPLLLNYLQSKRNLYMFPSKLLSKWKEFVLEQRHRHTDRQRQTQPQRKRERERERHRDAPDTHRLTQTHTHLIILFIYLSPGENCESHFQNYFQEKALLGTNSAFFPQRYFRTWLWKNMFFIYFFISLLNHFSPGENGERNFQK